MPPQKTIVFTGASGVVGSALLPELKSCHVVCLVHRTSVEDATREVIRCDITRPELGLDGATYRDLAARADCIIHSAAETEWSAPVERFQAVNIGGTERVIELSRAAGAPMYYISTSFIQALAPEAPLELPASNVIVNYVASKIACEKLIRDSGVPFTIFRPTNLVGDSRTGVIARTQAVQLVSEYICRGKLPLFPARPGTRVDVIPQDLAARAMAAVIEAEELGEEYWLTAGQEAMTIPEALEQCVAFMDRIGRSIAPPRTVHPQEVEPEEIAALPPMSRVFFQRVCDFSDGLTACGIFPSSFDVLRDKYDLPEISHVEAYVRGLEYWAVSKGLWQPDSA